MDYRLRRKYSSVAFLEKTVMSDFSTLLSGSAILTYELNIRPYQALNKRQAVTN